MSSAPSLITTPAPAPVLEAPPPRPPLMERLGVRYLRALSAKLPPVAGGDAVHVLNPEERARLRSIQRNAILRAFLAGATSALIAALAEIWATARFLPDPEQPTLEGRIWFWLVCGPVIGVAAGAEIAFLYWDGLRSVHRLAHAAGLQLFPVADREDSYTVAAALARAALEMPNPSEQAFGVDPRREASKVRLLLSSLVYKFKVGASNFVIKALVRRLLGRSVVRAYLAFVAVPITGIWDALVCWKVMREARIRAMGPSAVQELLRLIFADAPPLSAAAKSSLLRAVGSSIVRTFDLHPNVVAMLHAVQARVEAPASEVIDDSGLFLSELPALAPSEQALVIQTLTVAAIIDGRLYERERRLIRDALVACGRPPDDGPARRLHRAFMTGEEIGIEQLRRLY